MKTENVKQFNDEYIKLQAPMKICLGNTEHFSEMRDATKFTDEEKSEYIDIINERRAKIAEARIKERVGA